MSKYDLSITTPWILYPLIAYVIAILLNIFVVVPAMRRASTALESAGASGASGETSASSGYGSISALSGLVALLLLFAVVFMVWKP